MKKSTAAPTTTQASLMSDSPLLRDVETSRWNMEMEAESFRIADRHATAHLEAGRGWMMSSGDETNQHCDTFAAIAVEGSGGACIKEATQDLHRLDAMIEQLPPLQRPNLESGFPSDAACKRWSPEIVAAYYFGLALGFRLGRKDAL
jgi:hypothetical protein